MEILPDGPVIVGIPVTVEISIIDIRGHVGSADLPHHIRDLDHPYRNEVWVSAQEHVNGTPVGVGIPYEVSEPFGTIPAGISGTDPFHRTYDGLDPQLVMPGGQPLELGPQTVGGHYHAIDRTAFE